MKYKTRISVVGNFVCDYRYPKSKCDLVNKLVEEKSTEAACHFAEQKLCNLKHNPYPKGIQELG